MASNTITADLDSQIEGVLARRETKTDRKSYTFKPSVLLRLAKIARMDNTTENAALEQTIVKESQKIPLLSEFDCDPAWEFTREHVEKWVNVTDVLPVKKGDFLVRARGALIGDGAVEGDLILIRPQAYCDPNDTAIVMVEFPTGPRPSLKHVQSSANSSIVRLLPMNDQQEIIEVDASKGELRICGVKRGIIHAS